MHAWTIGVGEGPWAHWAVEALVVPVPSAREAWLPELAELDAAMAGAIGAAREDGFSAEALEAVLLYPAPGCQARRVVLVGVETNSSHPLEAYRQAIACGVKAVEGQVRSVGLCPWGAESLAAEVEAGMEGAALASTRKDHLKSSQDPKAKHLEHFWVAGHLTKAERGAQLAHHVAWVRRLSDLPGRSLPVQAFVDEIRSAAEGQGLSCEVLQGEALVEAKLGLLQAVGQASIHPPALVVVEHHGGLPGEPPILLVGKGITFDTGGLSIKPRAGMEEMKTDMHGGAAVIASVLAAKQRGLGLNLVGIVPIAENMPDGHATRPGDVVAAHNGLQVEIIDTDAEGRLILADALAYGVGRFQPRVVVDMATLTGSVIMALAYLATGLFTRDEGLAKALTEAGQAVGEPMWRLPMWEAYEFAVKSDIADLKNAAKEKGDAIHGAIFLQKFVGEVPYAHLDVAGPSYLPEGRHYLPKGSTGTGVRTLVRWLESQVVSR